MKAVHRGASPSSGFFSNGPLLFLAACVIGCGGGGSTSGGGGSQPSTPDFTLSLSASSLTVIGGSSTTITATVSGVNGFSSNVSLAVSNLPTGVTISPSTLQAIPGTPLQITFSAASTVAAGATSLVVTATSGLLSHSSSLGLTVQAKPARTSRSHYLRTDAVTEYGYWPNFGWTVFDSPTRRFFISDPFGNTITAIDATTQKKIAAIAVPGAYSLDESSDQTTIWVGTLMGDIYAIDPVSMAVKHRYLSSQIGANGFGAMVVRLLASGQMALLGNPGGIPGVDGFGSVAIWNSATNSIVLYGDPFLTPGAQRNCVRNIRAFTLTGDRSLVVMGGVGSNGDICTLDPATGQELTTQSGSGNFHFILATPDGNSLLIPSANNSTGTIRVFNSRNLTLTSTFSIAGDISSSATMMVSPDSKTIYMASPANKETVLYAYDIASGSQIGWTSNIYVPYRSGGVSVGSPFYPNLGAIDGTGLIAGPMEEGIGFLDTASMHTGAPVFNPIDAYTYAYFDPPTGSTGGGTQVKWQASGTGTISSVYFGLNLATNPAMSPGFFSATSPAGTPGVVDVVSQMKEGAEQIIPEAFSYGPTIVEITPNVSSANGGGTGIIYGYGLGSTAFNAPIPTDLQITVGGKSAKILGYANSAYSISSAPFLMQAFSYTIPSGLQGQSSDITVTTSSGSATVTSGMKYLPQTQVIPLAGAQLTQGIYDRKRDRYYFADANVIQVFSRSGGGQWLTPIPVPTLLGGAAHRLWGIALSPDGNKLAVSDANAAMIYVLNPDAPGQAQSFSVPGPYVDGVLVQNPAIHTEPAGLSISDSGMVYYSTFTTDGSGADGAFKLDTNTSQVTNYRLTLNSQEARVAVTSDGARAYFNNFGSFSAIDTASGAIKSSGPGWGNGDYDINLASTNTRLVAAGYLLDADLNAESAISLTYRDTYLNYLYGAKLSADGRLLFQPTTLGIDVIDGHTGLLRARIALPFDLAETFDAFVSDGTDNVLVMITGQTGTGVAVMDLTSLPEPEPLPYNIESGYTPVEHWIQSKTTAQAVSSLSNAPAEMHNMWHQYSVPHVVVGQTPNHKQVLRERD